MTVTEIEHKYVVADDFDQDDFFRRARSLTPKRQFSVDVQDVYFKVRHPDDHIYRLRRDRLICELTVKSMACDDNELRYEVNLPMALGVIGVEDVLSFLKPQQVQWHGFISKNVSVFEYTDCEVVFYQAATKTQSINCVEVEATQYPDVSEALAVIRRYEQKLGLDEKHREKRSLLQLLFPWPPW